MDSSTLRYHVPGDIMLTLAVIVNQGFEGLGAAALALRAGDSDASIASLQYLHGRLSLLHETLLAIVGEQDHRTENPHGSA